ncbi:MAG: acyl-CoA dehydrogenase family protein [Desulfomonilaceae bacterium]|nr:acyl-CoA dehydrogenase family protein [Desulfomonilaceae bacterium]
MGERKVFAGGEFLTADIAAADMFVPERFTEEHRMIFKTASDFIKKEVVPNLERIEQQDGEVICGLLRKAGEIGLNGTDVPVEYGGLDLDKVGTCVVAEAVGNGFSFAVTHANHTGISTMPIVLFGTEDQKKKYLPKLTSGEWMGAYCLTEPNAGSDALNSRTKAVLSEDGTHYVLNGEKIFITNSAWAESFIVYAKVDGEKFTGFIVERSYPGISTGPEEKKMGIKGSSTRPVVFQDCKVPVENVLLEVGQGHKVAFNALNIGRYKMGAFALGGCKTSIAEAVKYADNRIQFGRPIGSFGLIKKKLAEMSIRTYMSESLTYRVAAMIEDRLATLDAAERKSGPQNAAVMEEYAAECSICKVYGSECLDFCVDEWVQTLGGYGYCEEFMAERAYRDSRINRIFEGTNEINRLLIPGTFFKRAMQRRLPLLQAAQQAALEAEEEGAFSPPLEDPHFGREKALLRLFKNTTLLTMALAAKNFAAKLAEEQETVAMLADMAIEIFALESGLLRAENVLREEGPDKAEHYLAAVRAYAADTAPQMVNWAEQVMAHVSDDEGDAGIRRVLGRIRAVQPVDSVALKRSIADRVREFQRYPFGT